MPRGALAEDGVRIDFSRKGVSTLWKGPADGTLLEVAEAQVRADERGREGGGTGQRPRVEERWALG